MLSRKFEPKRHKLGPITVSVLSGARKTWIVVSNRTRGMDVYSNLFSCDGQMVPSCIQMSVGVSGITSELEQARGRDP